MTESRIEKFKATQSKKNNIYKAYGVGISKNRQIRLHIKRRDNTGTLIYYSYISTIEYSGSNLLSIFFHDSIINLKGKKLHILIDQLQDEKLRFIQEYDAVIFGNSPPIDETIIESIEFLSMKDLIK